ncbi:MAG: hypothetical protein AB7E80_16415 [Hyphomicrobiaceae bacterium]
MSTSTCPTCGSDVFWTLEEAFDKFGFGDGDGIVMTDHVADALRNAGYTVVVEPWGCHNVTISSIKSKTGKELIPFKRISFGYDDPRDYLPKPLIELLDAAFPNNREVGA